MIYLSKVYLRLRKFTLVYQVLLFTCIYLSKVYLRLHKFTKFYCLHVNPYLSKVYLRLRNYLSLPSFTVYMICLSKVYLRLRKFTCLRSVPNFYCVHDLPKSQGKPAFT